MKQTRRAFLGSLGAVVALGAVDPKPTFRITQQILDDWGACDWWAENFSGLYPDGMTGTAAQIAKAAEARSKLSEKQYDRLWILHELAKRVSGGVGDEALALLEDEADASRLAKAVIEITARDTKGALDRLIALGEAQYLTQVVEKATLADAETAATALAKNTDTKLLGYAESVLSSERRALLADARSSIR